jgi:glutathione S-transferase
VEAHLTRVEPKGGWFAGTGEDRPTSADFVMALTLQIFVVYASEYTGPKTREYIKKVQARPAYKKVSRFE